ncbi:AraC family transcriptional regulator [Bradyrhizobium sp. INPA03-11B]|uniref:AraC family transcriptional regulator n=1 Tax=Bradyrhizobium sp. INPA03-11B TaxID=418598 RepID=UPI00338FBE2E
MTDLTLVDISAKSAGSLSELGSRLGSATGHRYDIAAKRESAIRYAAAQAVVSANLGIASLVADDGISVGISQSLNGSDNVDVRLPARGSALALVQRDREAVAGPGQAVVSTTMEACRITYRSDAADAAAWQIRVAISRSLLQDHVRSSDCFVAALVDNHAGYLNLFNTYAHALIGQAGRLAPPALRVASRQMAELAALALGPNARGIEAARTGALGRARLLAAKAFVTQNISDPLLSEEAIAAHVKISVGQLRKDFEREGLAVARYLRDQRLDKARDLLSEEGLQHWRVIDIAFQCGFRDISTFNRAFRRRFEMTPSDTRFG